MAKVTCRECGSEILCKGENKDGQDITVPKSCCYACTPLWTGHLMWIGAKGEKVLVPTA